MDILYFFRHSAHNDIEIRYSLRSVARHMPFVRKVWVYGDRPEFLVDDRSLIEHVPHAYTARIGHCRTPLRNFFLTLFYSSLIPELSHEYLLFSDDYLLLRDVPEALAREDRYLENMDLLPHRGRGLRKESLWRTYDFLKRLGYPGYNFETHTPTYMTKKRVLEAYCDFKDYATQDPAYGFMGITAVLNHAHKVEDGPLVDITTTGLRVGVWGRESDYDKLVQACETGTFFFCDDRAFNSAIQRLYEERFPGPSIYESRVGSSAHEHPASGVRPQEESDPTN